MLRTKAILERKESTFGTRDCVIEKVIRLSGAEYDNFARNMLRDQAFIRDNPIDTVVDADGRYHCLLVTGEGRRDGVLVNPEGGDYARYSAFIPNAEDFLTISRYPALAALNHRLTDIVDFIVDESGVTQSEGRAVIDLRELETLYSVDLTRDNILHGTILSMLGDRPEINDWELDKNELIVYRQTGAAEHTAPDRDRPGKKPSVAEQIKAARQAPRQPCKDAPQKHKSKGGQEV